MFAASQMHQIPPILKLTSGGLPLAWVSWQEAAGLYARDRVRWEAGEVGFDVHGGRREDGAISILRINSIIAVATEAPRRGHVARPTPPLTNAALFERDGHLCMYCGRHHRHRDLSRDHVLPVSRGGRDTWDNVLTACRACNGRKDNRTPEEAGMLPLGLPYTPDHAAYLLLMGSGRVTGCQQAFLASMAKRRH